MLNKQGGTSGREQIGELACPATSWVLRRIHSRSRGCLSFVVLEGA